MKLFFVLTVATSAMLLVQGAPHVTSEEMGKAVEQLKEMITSEIQSAYHPWARQGAEAKSAYIPYYHAQSAQRPQSAGWPREQNYRAQSAQRPQSAGHPRKQGYGRQQDKVTAQVSGVSIQNCGPAGSIIQAALTPLNTLFPTQFGVLVNCQISPGCVQVRVDVPANNVLTDIDVCDLGNGQACVEVYVEPTTPCLGIIPITVPIPLSNGQQISIDIRIDPQIPFVSPAGCATVNVQAPGCP